MINGPVYPRETSPELVLVNFGFAYSTSPELLAGEALSQEKLSGGFPSHHGPDGQ